MVLFAVWFGKAFVILCYFAKFCFAEIACDIGIIGGGPVGLDTAYHISKFRPDLKVLIFEQFNFINDKGSSAGNARHFRLQYSEKYMSEFVISTLPYWAELEKMGEIKLIETVGNLWFGKNSNHSVEGDIVQAMKTMDALKIKYDVVNSSTVQTEYGYKFIDPTDIGFFQAQGGAINLRSLQTTLYNYLVNKPNVKLLSYSKISSLKPVKNSNSFVLTINGNNDEQVQCQKLILTPGAYVNEVLKHLGLWVNIDIWELTNAYYRMEKPNLINTTWYYFGKDRDIYGYPEISWSHPGYQWVGGAFPDRTLIDPYNATGIPSTSTLGVLNSWIRSHVNGLRNQAEYASTCLAAFSANPEKPFLLDFAPMPFNKNLVVFSGGWAAKFIPLLGKIIADLALNGTTGYNISHFKIDWPLVQDDTSPHFRTGSADGLELDVAIIGGGASGLYSAYRLSTGQTMDGNRTGLKVGIYERSNRIGGRVETIQLPGNEASSELGAMRYIIAQQIITSLIEVVFRKQFGLEHKDFVMGNFERNLFYLRERRFFASEFEKAKITKGEVKTGYKLPKKFKNKGPDDIMTEIVEKVLDAAGHPLSQILNSKNPRKTWLKVCKSLRYMFAGPYSGMKLNDMGFQNLIFDQSSQETLKFLEQSSGYHSNFINRNAVMAIYSYVVDFFKGQTYRTIEGGMEKLLYCLASCILNVNNTIWTSNELVTFERNSNISSPYQYVLTVYNRKTNANWLVYAKQVILAMPKRSLELINVGKILSKINPITGFQLTQNINSVLTEPAFKLLLAFSEPWWKNQLGTTAGFSITDLPISKCFYFTDLEKNQSVLLASYNDMDTVLFWEALETHQKRVNHSVSPIPSVIMVKEAMRQLKQLHGPQIDIPQPYATAFEDWGHDPFGAGYHDWKAKVKVWEVMPEVMVPDLDEQVYIVGEAYSEQQGWIEGAFCVAEQLMQEQFGLQRPDWLDAEYALGWSQSED